MPSQLDAGTFNIDTLRKESGSLLPWIKRSKDLASVRRKIYIYSLHRQFGATESADEMKAAISRDASRALIAMMWERSDQLAGFSVTQALWDISQGRDRPDLTPGFYAEMIHLMRALHGRVAAKILSVEPVDTNLAGREAATDLSVKLDRLWVNISSRLNSYPDGLTEASVKRRQERRERILAALGGGASDWENWTWHVHHIIRNPETLATLVNLRMEEQENIRRARANRLPFGVTPYYASLMDEDPDAGRDRTIRAQVLPPAGYVECMAANRGDRSRAFDFMREADTSPINLITRRYPGIVIIKPFNTCPQICVYCQRNWEIDDAMAPNALASPKEIEAACQWIETHPAVREVLITGGDPFALADAQIERIVARIAKIPSVDLIRLGTRTPVTLPMRITEELAEILGSHRQPGVREVAVVTHVEHPYEITPDTVKAVDRLRRRGIAVYNQLVYTFFVSRRFEAAALRFLIRRAGIDPYYTFAPKGKEETNAYRVPIARILQEQKEETRLLPGTRRTDEPVYNLPGTGKNYLRALQDRDLISVLPDGSRVYVFHPWEKNVVPSSPYVTADVPILNYLSRLAEIGEDPKDYESIWHYY